MKNCMYNNKLTTIEVFDDKIKLGMKTINYSDVYAINKDSLTNYLTLFTKNLFTFVFVASNLLIYLMTGYFSTFFLLLTFAITVGLTYWLKDIYITNLFGNDKFITYDIIYETHHDTIMVAKNDNIVINKNIGPKLRFLRHNQLQRYERRIKQGRKYLVTQCEADISSGDELFEKYKTVTGIRYKDAQNFSRAIVDTIETAINTHFSKFRKYTRYLLRVNIIMIVIVIYNFISSWGMYSIF